ncbi:MAG: thiamine diphosphokinase [Bacteroidales bacterium]
MKIREDNLTVILADGDFPRHHIPLEILAKASRIVCCDGASRSLIANGYEPLAIVGDCDSVPPEIVSKYADRIFRSEEQETNDLSKSVKWCVEKGFNEITILGATGKREDHTLGNISLLAEYAKESVVKMVTDTGVFYPLLKSGEFNSSPGQQVSVFSIDPRTEITSTGLKYSLTRMRLSNWWQATLNEATSDKFTLDFIGGPLIVFMAFT